MNTNQVIPKGWRQCGAHIKPLEFFDLVRERRLALTFALEELANTCAELESPDPGERCFLVPGTGLTWLDFMDRYEQDLTRVCAVVQYLSHEGLVEQRVYEGREGEVLTVMPWRIEASVMDTLERIRKEMRLREPQ